MGAESEKQNQKVGVDCDLESDVRTQISHTDDFDPFVESFIKIASPLQTSPLVFDTYDMKKSSRKY